MAVPEPATLVGVMVPHARPTDAESLKLIVPANPLTVATETVEVTGWPTLTGVGEVAVIVKSWTTNVTVTEWDREPLVPMTDTFLLPVDVNVQDRVAFPEPVTLVGETVQAEVLLVARLTMAAKPFRPVVVIVEVRGTLTLTLTLVGLAVTAKSWMV